MTAHPVKTAANANRLALAALLLGGIAIGGSPIFVRLSEVGPMTTAFWRVALAFIPLLIWSKAMPGVKRDARPDSLADYFWLSMPGIFLAADLAAWHLALHMTSVANATLLANLAPIFVTLGSWAIFRAHVSGIFLIGLATALIGVVVLKGGPAALGDGKLAGDATAAVAAIFYAGYILVIGRLRVRFSTRTIMIWSTASAAVCMLPVSVIFETGLIPLTLFGWAMLAGLALISHAAGQGMITYALAFLPPAFSSLTLLLQPVVAAALAWFLLSEPIGLMQAIGGVIVIFGILIARRG
ncbi:DMT family transporter [Phyllobacterium sp. YR531]|uniref:DMT family transporter n=1 Tax=Phyllobacterium sp. YR531 TaxID=1144343 RepID=UPI00026FAA42|nr:DMT family transporter [Phyllobacterium sp. YR531]EJM99321.1 putative permease, DMT superfamily [Phyllobacterium sp. YR531]